MISNLYRSIIPPLTLSLGALVCWPFLPMFIDLEGLEWKGVLKDLVLGCIVGSLATAFILNSKFPKLNRFFYSILSYLIPLIVWGFLYFAIAFNVQSVDELLRAAIMGSIVIGSVLYVFGPHLLAIIAVAYLIDIRFKI